MDFIKRIYIASIVLSLAFFAACGDSDSSDITTPNNTSETDITDTRDTATTVKDSSATGDSTAVNDSTATKDTTTAVKSSSSVENPSSANSTSSSSTGNSSSSSSITSNSTGSCDIRLDTLYGYPVTCDGIALGTLIDEQGKDYIIFENEKLLPE